MAIFENNTVVRFGRNISLFFYAEGRVTGLRAAAKQLKSRLGSSSTLAHSHPEQDVSAQYKNPAQVRIELAQWRQRLKQTRRRLASKNRELEQAYQQLVNKDQEIATLRAKLSDMPGKSVDVEANGVRPENIVWLFGYGRTGSTWLTYIWSELRGHSFWFEPDVGRLFGDLYESVTEAKRNDFHFVLGGGGSWRNSMRNFVLAEVAARFPETRYLLVKDQGGSKGATLLVRAIPESRLIFLVRDPRDAVASVLDAFRKGAWVYEQYEGTEGLAHEMKLANEHPDEFVAETAGKYGEHIRHASRAYKAHEGRKILVRYEDLHADTLDTMRHIYSALAIPVDEKELGRAVDKHAWDNIPKEQKGEGKFYRKATPGGWKEDLTPEQAKAVEEITAPILDEFYPGWKDRITVTPHAE